MRWNGFKRESPEPETMQTALRDAQGWSDLRKSLGWRLLQEEVVKEMQFALESMARGGMTHTQYERLSARMEVFRWLSDLPDRKYNSANDLLAEVREDERNPPRSPDTPVPPWEDE